MLNVGDLVIVTKEHEAPSSHPIFPVGTVAKIVYISKHQRDTETARKQFWGMYRIETTPDVTQWVWEDNIQVLYEI